MWKVWIVAIILIVLYNADQLPRLMALWSREVEEFKRSFDD